MREIEPGRREIRPMVAFVLVLALASVAYRLLIGHRLEQSALLFIGLPTMVALLMTNLQQPRSVTGILMRTVTWLLVLSGILFIEGVVCILFAAPLFYGTALIFGLVGDFFRWRKNKRRLNCCMGLLFVVMSLEGVTEALSFRRDRTVGRAFVIALTDDEVGDRLAAPPEFDLKSRPWLFKLGFPSPVSVKGEGVLVGDRRVIHFAGGEGHPGDLVLEVVESAPGRVVFACQSDSSHIAHWLDWQKIEVSWSGGHVRWNVSYRRSLDPAWYFAPAQDYAMRQAIDYLSETLFGELGERGEG